MDEVIRFALIGFGVGALYSLSSQGLLVIYRGSGVLNFALGAIGMVGAYVEWEVHTKLHEPFAVALVAGILASALIGVLTHLLLMRPLRNASGLARVAATLGVLIVLQSAAILRYGSEVQFAPSELPTTVLHISGNITISVDRLILLGIAAALTIGLWLLYRYTRFGIGTTATSENERAASALGWSPDLIAAINWGLGCGLAGLAAILIAPIATLQVSTMTNLVLAAMAAALVAGFRSFPIAFLAGMAIGIAQTEIDRFYQHPGFAESVPFLVIVAVLLIRGQALPLRDHMMQRLPALGSGRINWRALAVATAIAVLLITVCSAVWLQALTVTFGVSLVLLSIVVVTGYAGQISLGQYALAGMGAFIAGRLVATQDWPFVLAALAGVVGAVPVGVAFALPAVRTRGINLAIVTFGLGTAIELAIFGNGAYTGGFTGTVVGEPDIFGWSVSPITHPARYAFLCLGCLIVATILVANVRRSRSGRRLIAVRTNERATAALGIGVPAAKLYAFGLGSAVAALGGILIAFQNETILYTSFTNFTSITDVGWAFIGGIGSLLGPLFGATLAPGSIGTQISNEILSGLAEYIPLIGGATLILLVLRNQDGIAKETFDQLAALRARLPRRRPRPRPSRTLELPPATKTRARPLTFEARGLTVRYGGTTALEDVSFELRPGTVTGLIGPNGAGKTTAIDAVTGFARLAAGSLRLDGRDITGWNAARRARAGVSRSFQSLELFEDSTVLENLRVASDPRDGFSYLRDLVYPVTPPLPGAVVAAIEEFGLEDDLDRLVEGLPYGRRRLLAIARAVATQPSVLLLDEPAAGLDTTESAQLAPLVRRLADDWGIAVLVVEHDMDFVMGLCDSIVVLDFGHKIAEGTPREIREDEAVVAAYLGETDDEIDLEADLEAAVE